MLRKLYEEAAGFAMSAFLFVAIFIPFLLTIGTKYNLYWKTIGLKYLDWVESVFKKWKEEKSNAKV